MKTKANPLVARIATCNTLSFLVAIDKPSKSGTPKQMEERFLERFFERTYDAVCTRFFRMAVLHDRIY